MRTDNSMFDCDVSWHRSGTSTYKMKVLALLFVFAFVCEGAPENKKKKGKAGKGQIFGGLAVPFTGDWETEEFATSCLEILTKDKYAYSGEYYIKVGKTVILVYCEMGLNNGGYTFLHPASIPAVTDADIQEIFTNKARFLMRVLSTDGRQRVSVLKQIADFKNYDLKLGVNQYTDYTPPVNNLGSYLYFGFIPAAQATSRSANTQGVCVNGEDVTFKSLNRDGNSYFVLSPNFGETKVSETKTSYGICGKFFTLSFVNPSGRMMPVDYFMSAEIHFGGGGCFSVISQNTTGDTVAINIGFR